MANTLTASREGGCLCGAVRFRAAGEPLRTLVCHCRFCQRMTGSTSYAESMYDIGAVEITGETLSQYAHRSAGSDKLVYLHFCSRCGATVSLTFERWPQYRAISRGALDDPNSVSITSHIWTGSAQTGVVLPAATDCFPCGRAGLDGTPLPAERFEQPRLARTPER